MKNAKQFQETMQKLDVAAGALYDDPTLDNVRTAVQLVFPQHQVCPNETGEGFTVRAIDFVAFFESPQMFSDVVADMLNTVSENAYEAIIDAMSSGEQYAESTAVFSGGE